MFYDYWPALRWIPSSTRTHRYIGSRLPTEALKQSKFWNNTTADSTPNIGSWKSTILHSSPMSLSLVQKQCCMTLIFWCRRVFEKTYLWPARAFRKLLMTYDLKVSLSLHSGVTWPWRALHRLHFPCAPFRSRWQGTKLMTTQLYRHGKNYWTKIAYTINNLEDSGRLRRGVFRIKTLPHRKWLHWEQRYDHTRNQICYESFGRERMAAIIEQFLSKMFQTFSQMEIIILDQSFIKWLSK